MKQDKLEKYISENRAEFDTEHAPPGLWDKISEDLEQSKRKTVSFRRMLSIAAAGAVILCVGLLIGLRLGAEDPMKANPDLREFVQAEDYYANQFNVKWSEYKSMEPDNSSVENDLQQLDQVYNELKAELQQNPDLNTEKVIDALLQNYSTKIEILEVVMDRTRSKNLNNLKLNEDESEKI